MIKKLLDFSFHKSNYIPISMLVLSIIVIKAFSINEIEENSILENLQLVVLFLSFIFCFFAKKYKVLFNFIAFILFLMILREISYGRVIFCQIENNPHAFYPWSHYKYGFLANIIIGIYISIGIIIALINKIWTDIINIVNNIKFPFWSVVGIIISAAIQFFSENYFHSTIFEETGEFILYGFILSAILTYLNKIK